MGTIYDAMTRYLERTDWQYAPVQDGVSVALRFKGDEAEWSCVAQAVEEAGVFLFYSIAPEDVAAERRGEASEFVTRANYGMLTGAFELDLDGGDLRYRTGIRLGLLDEEAFGPYGLAEQLVEEAVRSNLVTANAYMVGLLSVLGGAPAADAIEEIEQAEGFGER